MNAARLTSRILFWGGLLSITVMVIGIIGVAVRGGLNGEILNERRVAENRAAARPTAVFTSVAQVRRALTQWPVDPLAVVAAGIVLLLATPFLGVVAAFVAFLAAGDRRYALISAELIAELLVSLLFATRGE
jgi:uncharacterized membrane protein